MTRRKILIVFGTRPEAIKVAPIIQQARRHQHELDVCTVVTAQHRTMLDQVLHVFDIQPDYDLDIMCPDQSLTTITVRALTGLDEVIQREKPNLVMVQGDTTTAFVGGLAAFYHQIPVAHVEAGLRTREKYEPFPEEINRHFLDVLADLCFVPTQTAGQALRSEGVPETRILVTGNTVIDALRVAVSQPHRFTSQELREIDFCPSRRTILLTAHRRENLGTPLEDVFLALRDVLNSHDHLQVVFPMHLNPKVRETASAILGDAEGARLIEPLDYLDFVHLMKRVDLVITDSGGIQEEAPALGKPVLVIRGTTERPEAVEAGTARLVGTDRTVVAAAVTRLIDDPAAYAQMQQAVNPFGDGHAAERTIDAVRHFFGERPTPPSPFEPDGPDSVAGEALQYGMAR